MSTKPTLPAEEKITVRWIIDYVPGKFWSIAIGALVAFAVGGFTLATTLRPPCSLSEVDALRNQRETLRSELAELEVKKANLAAQVISLEAEKEISSMTNGQIRNELSKWKRP